MGMKSMTDQRMGKSQVGSKCGGVGWVGELDERPPKTTRRGTAKIAYGHAPSSRFSALFVSGFRVSPPSPFIDLFPKERPRHGLSSIPTKSDVHRLPLGLNWIRSLRRTLRVTLQLDPFPFWKQKRLAIPSYDSIFPESRETICMLSIGQVETSMVAGVGLTSGCRSLPPGYGLYGSKHSTRRQSSTIQCSRVSGYHYPNTRCRGDDNWFGSSITKLFV